MGIFSFYHVIKGLRTGVIWNPILPNSDFKQIFDPSPDYYTRGDDGFGFWHSLIFHLVTGILTIGFSLKVYLCGGCFFK